MSLELKEVVNSIRVNSLFLVSKHTFLIYMLRNSSQLRFFMQLLRELIIHTIRRKERITFAEFMRMVLYHPEHGYYNSDRECIGRFGDYYTSPTLHSMFGELIAKQIEEMWRLMGEDAFTIVEMGANRGWLCHDILRWVKKEYPGFYHKLSYIIIEANPYAKESQKSLLNSLELSTSEKVSWHTYTENGFSSGRIQGCFLSNEFVDALPVHRIKIKNQIPRELYVGYNGRNFFEIEDAVSTQALEEYLNASHVQLREGHVYEINLDAVKWLKHISEKLQKGFVLTIDYGDTADKLQQGNGTGGMLRCFHKHTVNRDYYERLGEQDITTHVDFTSLMNAGELVGLKVTGFTKQSHYLIALGILKRLNMVSNDMNTILKVKNLFHPEGMGDVFKVLIQHKNIDDPRLTGLKPFF